MLPLLMLVTQLGVGAAPPARLPLTPILTIRRLPPAEVKGRPVRIVGVVTHWSRTLNDGFVQDDTGGIYLTPTRPPLPLRPGDRIEVTGVSDPGEFAPCIIPRRFRVLGRGTLPDAEPFDLDPETAGRLDGQYVHVNAYAYGVERLHAHRPVRRHRGRPRRDLRPRQPPCRPCPSGRQERPLPGRVRAGVRPDAPHDRRADAVVGVVAGRHPRDASRAARRPRSPGRLPAQAISPARTRRPGRYG